VTKPRERLKLTCPADPPRKRSTNHVFHRSMASAILSPGGVAWRQQTAIQARSDRAVGHSGYCGSVIVMSV
jgi:hypothetical protein